MVKMKVLYQGGKHCEAEHESSGSKIETDAPVDNGGQGHRFSPTDLVGAALGSCILTTMEILAEKQKISLSLKGAWAEVSKEMSGVPRRIQRLQVDLHLPAGIPESTRHFLQKTAETCPVGLSLHPDLQQQIRLIYPD